MNIGRLLFLVINDQSDKKTGCFFPMIAYGQFFWFNFKICHDEKEVRMTINYVPQKKWPCLFKIKLSIVLEPKKYKVSSMMSFKDLTGNQDNFLSLPSSTIDRFLDSDNKLTFNLSIERVAIPE